MNRPTPATWAEAGRRLLRKAIAEFAYEELLTPQPIPDQHNTYRLTLPNNITWTFTATRGTFGTWHLTSDPTRHPTPPDDTEAGPERLLLDARPTLGWDGPTTAEILRELTATRTADATTLTRRPTAAQLADLDHLDLEAHQDGHPCMLLNKGRLGFSSHDTATYSPEAAGTIRLLWTAVHTSLARYSGTPHLDADTLLTQELDPHTRSQYTATLDKACATTNHQPTDYHWMPIHPYHWDEAVETLFAPYLADGRIIPLGESPDRYRPLQSIRTLANLDHPHRRNVKVPLLIRNTLVWRGLSTEPTHAAPDISHWLHTLRETDPYLSTQLRFHPLGEEAAVSVHHPLYTDIPDAPYRYHELLGAVWREPITTHLRDGETARTMAALLTTGSDDRPLVTELIHRSGRPAEDWITHLLSALLPGLLHHLYAYGVAFCPHGENTIILYDTTDTPIGIAIKDFAEDVNLLPEHQPHYTTLSEKANTVLLRWPAPELAHSLQSAIFAGHFRYFAPLLERHGHLKETRFWQLVRDEITTYHKNFPQHAHRATDYGLLNPEFDRIALNREQLLGGAFHDRAERDEGFDITHGRIPNPLHTPQDPT